MDGAGETPHIAAPMCAYNALGVRPSGSTLSSYPPSAKEPFGKQAFSQFAHTRIPEQDPRGVTRVAGVERSASGHDLLRRMSSAVSSGTFALHSCGVRVTPFGLIG